MHCSHFIAHGLPDLVMILKMLGNLEEYGLAIGPCRPPLRHLFEVRWTAGLITELATGPNSTIE
jgi:hypothetical protein